MQEIKRAVAAQLDMLEEKEDTHIASNAASTSHDAKFDADTKEETAW